MPFYEYKVVPAPERAPKVRGLKGTAKFAHSLETLMNGLAHEGWEYLRAESLPDEEKKGIMGGRETVTRYVLIFRRELYFEEASEAPEAEEQAPPARVMAEAPAEPPEAEPLRLTEEAPPEPQPERRPLFAERRTPPGSDS